MITKNELFDTRELLFRCLHFYIDCHRSDFSLSSIESKSFSNSVWSELTSIIQVLSILSSLIEKANEND